MNSVDPIPKGYHSLTPYLLLRDAARAIDFYRRAFDAVEIMRLPGPDGRIGHAEVRIGDSSLMMADETPDGRFRGPQSLGGVSSSLLLYVRDCDAIFARAVAAGATVMRPVADQFYGDRSGTITDPFGHVWTIATHVRDVSAAEMEKLAAEATRRGNDKAGG